MSNLFDRVVDCYGFIRIRNLNIFVGEEFAGKSLLTGPVCLWHAGTKSHSMGRIIDSKSDQHIALETSKKVSIQKIPFPIFSRYTFRLIIETKQKFFEKFYIQKPIRNWVGRNTRIFLRDKYFHWSSRIFDRLKEMFNFSLVVNILVNFFPKKINPFIHEDESIKAKSEINNKKRSK